MLIGRLFREQDLRARPRAQSFVQAQQKVAHLDRLAVRRLECRTVFGYPVVDGPLTNEDVLPAPCNGWVQQLEAFGRRELQLACHEGRKQLIYGLDVILKIGKCEFARARGNVSVEREPFASRKSSVFPIRVARVIGRNREFLAQTVSVNPFLDEQYVILRNSDLHAALGKQRADVVPTLYPVMMRKIVQWLRALRPQIESGQRRLQKTALVS